MSSAHFIIRRFALSTATSVRLSVGVIALGLLLIAEILLVIGFRSQSLGAYIASRDVYLAMLALFAVMPLILARTRFAREPHLA